MRSIVSGTQAWACTVASTTPGPLSNTAGGPQPQKPEPLRTARTSSVDSSVGWAATEPRGLGVFQLLPRGCAQPEFQKLDAFLSAFWSSFLSCSGREGSHKPQEKSAPWWVHLGRRRPKGLGAEAAADLGRCPAAEGVCDEKQGARSSSSTQAWTTPRTERGGAAVRPATALAWVPGVSTGGSLALPASWGTREGGSQAGHCDSRCLPRLWGHCVPNAFKQDF